MRGRRLRRAAAAALITSYLALLPACVILAGVGGDYTVAEADATSADSASFDTGADAKADGGRVDGAPFGMFVVAEPTPGNLKGIAGADERCQTASLAAGLPGRYVSLLAARDYDPFVRLAPGRYVNTKGETLSESKLTSIAKLSNTILDENGVAGPKVVWTGGYQVTVDCGRWAPSTPSSGRIGDSTLLSGGWFNNDKLECINAASIYCVEVP